MPKTVDKLTAFKALLGDEAAKKVVEAAEAREKTAKQAGVEFKDKTDKPVLLSNLLEELDAAIASGAVVDDVNEAEEQTTQAEAKEHVLTLADFKEVVEQVVDAKLTAFKAELAKPTTTEKEAKEAAEAEKQKAIEALQTSLKETQTKLAELTGEQPRAAAYRASRAEETVVATKNTKTPGPDPLGSFIDDLVIGVARNGVSGG